MHIDEVVGMIIQSYLKERGTKDCMSRQRLPCTRCRVHTASTWRPGPCGTSSLCNACGLQYMVRGERPRMVDLVVDEGRVIWMTRHSETFQWEESHEADKTDFRIQKWARHEGERVEFVERKKRKFVDL